MVESDRRVAAELAYQRALTALHEARQELAEVAAARRRLAYDRLRLDAVESERREEELDARHGEASGRVERLREVASGLREQVRRWSPDGSPEPAEVPEVPAGEGFEQPPYPGLQR